MFFIPDMQSINVSKLVRPDQNLNLTQQPRWRPHTQIKTSKIQSVSH
uniref:Uncharacterized protein n=1 Tax=Rhizophora mucronata TaxID=61149 RepID=A0A2P2PWR7_RHIMU